jgi:hypothetical protein
MAKKKGEGSNLGLIITLVFFVLSTVILGVTTYMGFSAQEEKDKAVKKMSDEKNVADNDAKWNRALYRIVRAYHNNTPAGVDAAEVAREKAQIDAGQFTPANNQKDKDEALKYLQGLNARHPWDTNKGTAPSRTIEQYIAAKEQEIEGLKVRVKRAEESAAREKREKEEAEAESAKTIASLKAAMDTAKTKALDDRKADLGSLDKQRVTLEKEGKERSDLRFQLDELQKAHDKQTAKLKQTTNDLAKAKQDLKTVTDERDDKTARYNALLEKTGQDPRAIEATVLDAKSTQMLRDWKKDWRIVEIDRTGNMPYINLGSADNLSPQVTFSIHAVGLDGKLSPTPKGSMEVVRVVGSHLAQARVTSIKDPKKDPILKGDRLFNPTWDPSRKKRVAIAGLADLGGDGSDNTEDLRRLLRRQNVEIDAWIDIKDDKAPKIEGKGITVNTDFLILGDSLDALNHPKAREKGYKEAFDKHIRELKDKATTNGVPVIALRKYLDMIGYQAPRLTTTSGGYGR